MEEGNKYKQLIEDGQQYIRTRYDLLRLELLEKMSRIFALILMLLVSIILALTAFIYFSFAFVRWLGQFFNNDAWAFCIVGAIFLLLLGIFFFFRKQIFLNPLIRQLSEILFRKPEEEQDESTKA